MPTFTISDQVCTFADAAEALAASGVYSTSMMQAALQEFCFGLAVASEVEGRAWSTELAQTLLHEHQSAHGAGEGVKLWAAFIRASLGGRRGVPNILLRPLVLDALLCACPATINGKLPRVVELAEPDNSPSFNDIMKDVWPD